MDNKNKGITFIIGGILSYFMLPKIFYTLEIYFIPYTIFPIISIILIGFGIVHLFSKKKSLESLNDNEEINNSASNKVTNIEDDTKYNVTDNKVISTPSTVKLNNKNKIINVYLAGGIIGALGVSPHLALNKAISKENVNGWKVVQVIPASSGNLFLLVLRYILLVITLFFYTTANGYYVILEKIDN